VSRPLHPLPASDATPARRSTHKTTPDEWDAEVVVASDLTAEEVERVRRGVTDILFPEPTAPLPATARTESPS
jgi:hypothetical protein